MATTSHRYGPYLERPQHAPHCPQTCGGCDCDVHSLEVWALARGDVRIPRPGKWMVFPESASDGDVIFRALSRELLAGARLP
jgi:hypothetical protein